MKLTTIIPRHNHVLRRVRDLHFSGLLNVPSPSSETTIPKVQRLMEVSFKSVKCDYIFIQDMPSGALACHHKRRYQLAIIRQSHAAVPLQMLEAFSVVHHPNVADIFGAYFHAGELHIVGEYLTISLIELGFEDQAPEEWEIATVVKEVGPSCSPTHCGALTWAG